MHRKARVRKPSARCARSVLPTVSCVPATRELVSGGPLPLTWPRVAMGLPHTCLPLHHPSTSAGRDFQEFGLPGVLEHAGRTGFPGFWSSRSAGFPWPGPFWPFLALASSGFSWPGPFCPILALARQTCDVFPRPGGQRQGHWALSRSPGALSAAGPLRCRGPAVPCSCRFI